MKKSLSVCVENIEFEFKNTFFIEWSNFLLNPRRLRGSDFLMRWSQGVWSEERLTQAVNRHGEFFIIPYGPSGTAPDDDVKAFELYFERLEAAGLGQIKRPDLLVFKREDERLVMRAVENIGGISELPFTTS
ncbi:MAG: AccI family restriction endonuclease [Chloroflexota bacterium]